MPKRHALMFGLNYAGQGDLELKGCVNDARFWSQTVQNLAFDSHKVLVNSQCSRNAMAKALTKTVQQAASGDLVVLCYSGHGTIVPPGVQSWVPIDFDWKNPKTWFTYDDLDRMLMASEQSGVLVVVITDSCFSKANPRKHFRKMAAHRPKNRFLNPPPWIQKRMVVPPFHRNILTVDQDDLLLAACQKDQTSADDEIDGVWHGAFTYALSQALEDNPKATYHQAILKARAWLAENDYDQVPSGNGSPDLLKLTFFSLPKRGAR